MSWCETASAWIRCAPSATNISPTTDLPAAMPPVRPVFRKRVSVKILNAKYAKHAWRMQRKSNSPTHRRRARTRLASFGKLRHRSSQFGGAHCVGHEHSDGQWAHTARYGSDGTCHFHHCGMNISDQNG